MTTLTSAATGIADRFADPFRDNAMNATIMDAAVVANRRSTPQAAIDKRTSPRYSIGEINQMDWENVRERFNRLPSSDTRPGIVRFLDIIDLPRNMIANGLTAVAMPHAREEAIKRGDFDDLGLPKVWGSDMLRGLGIDNKIVNGVVGFGLDIAMDPISWIGGPIGGLKTSGARGAAVSIGRTGEKALRTSLNAVGKGREVTNPTIRRLFETTAKRHSIDLAKGADAEDALSRALVGDVGGFASGLGTKAGLGTKGAGGDIANFFGRSATVAETAEEADHIRAVGQFIDEFTLNRGPKMGANPGTALAHVPLTDITLSGPAFTRRGHDAVMQRAAALATEGKPVAASFLSSVMQSVTKTERLAKEAETLYEAKKSATSTGNEEVARLLSDAASAKVREAIKAARESVEARKAALTGTAGLDAPENLGDLIATADLHRRAESKFEAIKKMQAWRDVDNLVPRATRIDTKSARKIRAAIASDAGLRPAELADPFTVADGVAPLWLRRREFDEMVAVHRAREDDRLGDLVALSDSELDTAAKVADAFTAYTSVAYEHSMLSRTPLVAALNSDDRMLAKASARLLGIDDQTAGAMRLASISNVFDHIGGSDAEKIAVLSHAATEAFGTPDSVLTRAVNRMIAVSRGFDGDLSSQLRRQFERGGGGFTKGLHEIAKTHGIKGHELDRLDKIVAAVGIARHDDLHAGYWQTLVSGEDTAVARAIKSSAEEGWLRNTALMEDITQLADEMGQLWKADREHSLRERQLNFALVGGGYFPINAKPELAKRIGQLGDTGVEKRAGIAAKENFQKGRELVEIRFKDADGNWHSYLELERNVYGKTTKKELALVRATHGDDVANELKEKVATFKLFDKTHPGVGRLGRVRHFGRALDPFELNEMVDSGIFKIIAGGPMVSREMFETSAAHAIASRGAGRAAADAKQALVEGVIRPLVLPVNTKIPGGQVFTPGKSVTLADGSVVHALGGGRLKVSNKFGSTVYRKLDTLPLGQGEPLFRATDLLAESGLYSDYIPEVLAEQVTRMERALRPRHLGVAMRNADKVTKLWRVSTLAHPSWMVVNAIGNSILYTMAYPETVVKRGPSFLTFATKALLARNNPEKLAGLSIKLFGQNVNAADLLRVAGAERVTGGGYNAETIEHLFGQLKPQTAGDAADAVKHAFKSGISESFAESMHASRASKMPDYIKRGRASLNATASVFRNGAYRPVVNAWFRTNGMIDDTFRLAALMAEMDRGSDAVQGAAGVRNALLNFGDLTAFESEKLRPLMPFYSWTRASLPNMLSKLFEEPRYFGMVPKLQQAMEELTAGESKVPRHMRPRWLQEQIGIQVGADPEVRKIVTIGTMLPQEGAMRTVAGLAGTVGQFLPGRQGFDGQDFMDYFDFWLSQTNPMAKVFVDLGTGRETFTGRTIGPTSMEGDLSISEHLWNQIRLAREFGIGSARRGALPKSFGEGLAPGIGRLLIGGRLQPFEEDRRKFGIAREMREKEEGARRAIRIAQREQNETAERKARVHLLRVYRDFLNSGGDAGDIPKWAGEQIAELDSSS